MANVVAIHQPNFFPWLGYFDKINKSDVFILMDNVQFPKKGGVWTNRVKIMLNGQPEWLTLPIVRSYHGFRLIKDMEINNSANWRGKMLKTIEQNYKSCPFFKDVWNYIQALINYDTNNLCAFNVHTITSLAEYLGLDKSKLILGSSLKAEGNATELLISMTKAVEGSVYMCGGGADGYQDDEKFSEHGLKLLYQDFKHPEYPQYNSKEFIPGLSVMDALMNCGIKGTKKLISDK